MTDTITNPYAFEDISPANRAEWEARRRVATSIRQLSEILLTSTPTVQELHTIAAELEGIAAGFANMPRLYGRLAFAAQGSYGRVGQIGHETNPVAGVGNPLAPPLKTWIADGVAHGRVTMGWAYEGPPTSVHGGFVAALFDQFMGEAQAIGGQPGMTGTLEIRYHQRTPLNTELQLRGWVEKVERRKTWVRAEMRAGDTLTASCNGVFIQPRGGLAAFHDNLL